MNEQTPSSPNNYDPDRLRYWFTAISNHGGDVRPSAADPDEADAFLGLYIDAPKKVSSEDQLMVNRVHLHLMGLTYREIAELEVEEGYARVGKTAIQNAVYSRVPAIIAEQLQVIDGSDSRYRANDIFRPQPMGLLKQEIMALSDKAIKESDGQPELENALEVYRLDAVIRTGQFNAANKTISRALRYLKGIPMEQIANSDGVTLQSISTSIHQTLPRAIARVYDVDTFHWEIRKYYAIANIGDSARPTLGYRIECLEAFQDTKAWLDLTHTQRTSLTRSVRASLPVDPTVLKESVMPEGRLGTTEAAFNQAHLQAISAFDAYLTRRLRRQS